MDLPDLVRRIGRSLSRLAQFLAGQRDTLTCGECDRQESCGLPPSENCVHRLMLLDERRRDAPRVHSMDYLPGRRPL